MTEDSCIVVGRVLIVVRNREMFHLNYLDPASQNSSNMSHLDCIDWRRGSHVMIK